MTDHYETPGFVPISAWPTLVDLCAGFDENLLPDSVKLEGIRLVLVLDDGYKIEHYFKDTKKLHWRIVEGNDHVGVSDEAAYRAFEVRPGLFFLDFYKEKYEEQVTLVIDLDSGRALVAISSFYLEDGGARRTRTRFNDAYVQGSVSRESFKLTTELIGKHIMYQYTGNDVYEHVYFNQGTFSWHCLSGTENGLADTEPCKMLKLGDELYLLFWTEKIMPVESVVVIDLKQMRSTGRFFCWDPKYQKLVHTLFGSRATLLGDTVNMRPGV